MSIIYAVRVQVPPQKMVTGSFCSTFTAAGRRRMMAHLTLWDAFHCKRKPPAIELSSNPETVQRPVVMILPALRSNPRQGLRGVGKNRL